MVSSRAGAVRVSASGPVGGLSVMSAWCVAAALECALVVNKSGVVEEAGWRASGVQVAVGVAELVAVEEEEEAAAGCWARLGKLGLLVGPEPCERSTRSH